MSRPFLSLMLAVAAWAAGIPSTAQAAGALQPYRSEAEFIEALDRWRAEAARRQPELRRRGESAAGATVLAAPAPATMAAAKSAAESAGPAAAADSITHVQTAGVDEGGIVKRAGDHLIILRRGRLFTVQVGQDALQPVAMADAYAPGISPQGAWYDELLVSGRDVVVIGYSYARGGTEVGLFELGTDGALTYRATWHLRSFDYFSSRNYASRLVGRTLVFYTPTLLQPWGPKPYEMMPAWRRWQPQAVPGDFRRLLPATRIHRTDDDFDPAQPLALHTVTRCNLDAPDLGCESTAVLGPQGRVFYVSAESVYVWTSHGRRADQSAVFRLPLSGAAPSGLKTAGVPIDQLSFLEADGHLQVLLRATGRGEGMWGAEQVPGGTLALMRVPLTAFGDGRTSAQREHYRRLPAGHVQHNRYVGDWLLWGAAADDAWAVRWARSDAEPSRLTPGHRVERIEPMGRDAVVIGNAGADLHFSRVALEASGARLAGRHVQRGASQGEQRSHGFFYRATGAEEGVLGLPVLDDGPYRGGAFASRGRGSAGVVFLRQRADEFLALGELRASGDVRRDDACKASCVDWYGNARPIFLGERVFALLGYELVEGQRVGGGFTRERVQERRRISFAPDAAPGQRYSPFP